MRHIHRNYNEAVSSDGNTQDGFSYFSDSHHLLKMDFLGIYYLFTFRYLYCLSSGSITVFRRFKIKDLCVLQANFFFKWGKLASTAEIPE